MKKLNLLLFLITLILYQRVEAQQDSVFTLDQCIDYAFENQATVKNAVLDQQIAQYKVKETRGLGMPQVSADVNTLYNVQLQRLFMRDGAYYSLSGAAAQGVPPPSNPNQVIAIQQFLQLPTTNTASVTANQILFDGAYLVALQASKTYTELSVKSTTQTKIEAVDKITKAFYLVLINEQRMKLLNVNLARMDTALKQLRQTNKNGLSENLDVSRLEVAYNNLQTDRVNVMNQLILTYSMLKYQMGYPVNEDFRLSGSLDDLVTRLNMENSKVTNEFDYNNRIEYSLLQTQKRLQELNYKSTMALSLPRLTAFGTAGTNNSQADYMKLYSTPYYAYGFVGARLSIPVFSGLNKYYQQQGAKIGIQKIQNNLQMMENTIDLQINQSHIMLQNNLANIKSQKRNLELAEQVTRITKVKFDEGVGSNLEVVDAENSFKTAQTNYYNAVYDALVSLIDYQKATGTLYNK
jgi:outer membrane protein